MIRNVQKACTSFLSEQQIVQDQVIDILPMVSEANAISEELNKYCQFEAVLAPIVSQEFGLGERTSKYVHFALKVWGYCSCCESKPNAKLVYFEDTAICCMLMLVRGGYHFWRSAWQAKVKPFAPFSLCTCASVSTDNGIVCKQDSQVRDMLIARTGITLVQHKTVRISCLHFQDLHTKERGREFLLFGYFSGKSSNAPRENLRFWLSFPILEWLLTKVLCHADKSGMTSVFINLHSLFCSPVQ